MTPEHTEGFPLHKNSIPDKSETSVARGSQAPLFCRFDNLWLLRLTKRVKKNFRKAHLQRSTITLNGKLKKKREKQAS